MNQQDQQHNSSHHNGDQGLVHLHGVGRNIGVAIQIGNPVPPHQQPVGIDSVRRTGQQCTIILSLYDLQF